jgi:hypothetical protein
MVPSAASNIPLPSGFRQLENQSGPQGSSYKKTAPYINQTCSTIALLPMKKSFGRRDASASGATTELVESLQSGQDWVKFTGHPVNIASSQPNVKSRLKQFEMANLYCVTKLSLTSLKLVAKPQHYDIMISG